MATSFSGWTGRDWNFDDWSQTTVEVRRRPASGHAFASHATGMTCKADGQKLGLVVSDVGARDVPERKFFFPAHYRKTGSADRATVDYVQVADTLRDVHDVEWTVLAVSEPGDADEHLEVLTRKGVPE